MKRQKRTRIKDYVDIRLIKNYIDFNSCVEQIIEIPLENVSISCIVKPLKSIEPATNQLSLFPDSFLEKSSRKYD